MQHLLQKRRYARLRLPSDTLEGEKPVTKMNGGRGEQRSDGEHEQRQRRIESPGDSTDQDENEHMAGRRNQNAVSDGVNAPGIAGDARDGITDGVTRVKQQRQ